MNVELIEELIARADTLEQDDMIEYIRRLMVLCDERSIKINEALAELF